MRLYDGIRLYQQQQQFLVLEWFLGGQQQLQQ